MEDLPNFKDLETIEPKKIPQIIISNQGKHKEQ